MSKGHGIGTGAAAVALMATTVLLAAAPGSARACVGRTLYVGYYDAPAQVMVAQILSVFIDERTGTTVKMTRFGTRDEAFEAIRNDRISLFADYSGIVLARFGGETPGPDPERNIARLKEILNGEHNVVWLEPFGFDRNFSDKVRDGGNGTKGRGEPGPAGLMLCKDALSKFPALPKLLGKLRGVLDNETMAGLLRDAKESDPRAVARRFLKSRKLI
jgi:osmoprotectant transport system substrate-binding protein